MWRGGGGESVAFIAQGSSSEWEIGDVLLGERFTVAYHYAQSELSLLLCEDVVQGRLSCTYGFMYRIGSGWPPAERPGGCSAVASHRAL